MVALNVAAAGSYETVRRHNGTLEKSVRREVSFRDVALMSYETEEESVYTTFLWRSAHHELYWTVAGRDVSFSVFTEMMAAVDLNDSASGLLVTPRRGTGTSVTMVLAANTLTNLCAVAITPTTSPSIRVPAHSGKQVKGGVMWRTDTRRQDGSLERTATIAGATAVTDLGFFDPDAPANVELAENFQVAIG
ncbi:hypothetical protein Adu01nite_71050 [Paractinoplanes durhamensis]|uniref:Uncharacterized protein n=1 Tax=Paractinoplanes durhamensis TaxID=113563 RepID=A0ABQ3Z7F6_9ACTN|nr:hypothetical protein Adu01nite_71050 [Actinoplanes durhamensis]